MKVKIYAVSTSSASTFLVPSLPLVRSSTCKYTMLIVERARLLPDTVLWSATDFAAGSMAAQTKRTHTFKSPSKRMLTKRKRIEWRATMPLKHGV